MTTLRFQLITFDVYTALFDVEGSLTPLVGRTAVPDASVFVRNWRRKQLEYALISNSLGQERIPFSQITELALDDTLQRTKVKLSEEQREELLQAWGNLTPWPEAASVLEAVQARGYTLGLLSNGDTHMLRALLKQLPPVIEHVFSTEAAGHYKPHASVYALPLDALHLKADDMLHVAGSQTDALGTGAAGLHCAWSNRRGEAPLDPRYPPDFEFKDLRGLLELV